MIYDNIRNYQQMIEKNLKEISEKHLDILESYAMANYGKS